jgi:hypothetical protein
MGGGEGVTSPHSSSSPIHRRRRSHHIVLPSFPIFAIFAAKAVTRDQMGECVWLGEGGLVSSRPMGHGATRGAIPAAFTCTPFPPPSSPCTMDPDGEGGRRRRRKAKREGDDWTGLDLCGGGGEAMWTAGPCPAFNSARAPSSLH